MKTMRMGIAAALAAIGGFAAFGGPELKLDLNVPYLEGEDLSTADDYRREMCKVDIERAPDAKGQPVLVWFHGGGLTGGHKCPLKPLLFREKIVQVAAGYRLMGRNGVESGDAPISDAAAAVAWTLRHIAEYGGDPKKVFVSGSSAGGYLTMMVGMDPKWLGKHGFRTSDLAGLAPNSGQATTHFAIKQFRKDPHPGIVPVIDEYAPLYHTANWKDIPPIACITGEPPWEWKGRAEENELLIGTLKGLGHRKAWYVRLPFADHGRTMAFGPSYVERFVLGQYPENPCLAGERK